MNLHERARKAATAIYLAVPGEVADDISGIIGALLAENKELTNKLKESLNYMDPVTKIHAIKHFGLPEQQ